MWGLRLLLTEPHLWRPHPADRGADCHVGYLRTGDQVWGFLQNVPHVFFLMILFQCKLAPLKNAAFGVKFGWWTNQRDQKKVKYMKTLKWQMNSQMINCTFVSLSITLTELTKRRKVVTSITMVECATVISGDQMIKLHVKKIMTNSVSKNQYSLNQFHIYHIIFSLVPLWNSDTGRITNKVRYNFSQNTPWKIFLQNSLPLKGFHYGGFFSEHQAAKVTIGARSIVKNGNENISEVEMFVSNPKNNSSTFQNGSRKVKVFWPVKGFHRSGLHMLFPEEEWALLKRVLPHQGILLSCDDIWGFHM